MGSMLILFIYGSDIMSLLSQTWLLFLNGPGIISLLSQTWLPPVTEEEAVMIYLFLLCLMMG